MMQRRGAKEEHNYNELRRQNLKVRETEEIVGWVEYWRGWKYKEKELQQSAKVFLCLLLNSKLHTLGEPPGVWAKNNQRAER